MFRSNTFVYLNSYTTFILTGIINEENSDVLDEDLVPESLQSDQPSGSNVQSKFILIVFMVQKCFILFI